MASPPSNPKKFPWEDSLEWFLFNTRWLLAPMYLGLVVSLGLMVAAFFQELIHGAPEALESPEKAIVLSLSLIDLSLAANLLLMVIFSGYENFVSKIDTRGSEDRPAWMGTLDFSALKIKLIGSIVAISAISLLRAFMSIHPTERPPNMESMAWMVGLHMVFVASGVLFAVMDWTHVRTETHADEHQRKHAD